MWVESLLLAEQWHVPPWELEEAGTLVWVERWRALQEARANRQRIDGERAERDMAMSRANRPAVRG